MKKLILFTFLGLAFFNLSSCNNDDNNDNVTIDKHKKLKGVWKLIKDVEQDGATGNASVTRSPNSCTAKSTYEFNGTHFITKYFSFVDDVCEQTSESSRAYTFDEKNDLLMYETRDEPIYIQKLTDTELELITHITHLNSDDVEDKIIVYYEKIQ